MDSDELIERVKAMKDAASSRGHSPLGVAMNPVTLWGLTVMESDYIAEGHAVILGASVPRHDLLKMMAFPQAPDAVRDQVGLRGYIDQYLTRGIMRKLEAELATEEPPEPKVSFERPPAAVI